MSDPHAIAVSIVSSPGTRQIERVELQLPQGSVVRDALQASLFWQEAGRVQVGIWGRKVGLDEVLHAGDRIEIYRPLRVDPKRARRERFERQGSKGAGLFAQRPSAGKPRP